MDQDTLQALMKEAVKETVSGVSQLLLHFDQHAFLQDNGGKKNGFYRRTVGTRFGTVDLAIPRDREGRSYPSFLLPSQRRLVEVGDVAIALSSAGVSQRQAAEVLAFL